MIAPASFFLRVKHWQIFLFLFVVPNAVEFAAMIHLPTRIWSWRDFGPWGFLFIGGMFFEVLSIVCWFGSLGVFLLSIVKPELRMDKQFFRFAVVYPLIYVPIFFPMLLTDVLLSKSFVVPLHLICMICLFYLLYFVAKSLALVEKEKSVTFYEYAGPFFLLWFYPIGVWFIQPRINRLEETAATPLNVPGSVPSA